jgi:uncharacterized membrane protein
MTPHGSVHRPSGWRRAAAAIGARPRLLGAVIAGAIAYAFAPQAMRPFTRALIGWNVAVWLHLLLIAWMMLRGDHGHLRRTAAAQAEGEVTVLVVAVLASLASLVGVVAELAAARAPGAVHEWPPLLLALATVVGSWLLVPTLFTLTYASIHFRHAEPGLRFPDQDPGFQPHYGDFLYFAFTIAVASQTADVAIASPHLRRIVLLHSIVSFAFNTAILAFTVNIAASMF